MNIVCIGCTHREAPVAVREQLALDAAQTVEALRRWRTERPDVEAVLLPTCNRVELYAASEQANLPKREELVAVLAEPRRIEAAAIEPYLVFRTGEEAVRHLFEVASSLDSMVVGEPQIQAQVKDAYQAASEQKTAGPLLHAAFQAALGAARRVGAETAIHQRRVSIPSVAVADFARQIFERFDDKHTVVIGAGEMAEETLRYLRDAGAHQITVINRRVERAEELSERWHGRAAGWEQLIEALATADVVVSTTAAGEPVVTAAQFERVERARQGRPMFILDLAVPRDFDPAIGRRPDVYLYSIDDLKSTCDRNQQARDSELPRAARIIEQETSRFVASARHRESGPIIERLRRSWARSKDAELERLLNKLPQLDQTSQEEIRIAFDRLVNKLLHPPLESLRDEARNGVPRTLMEALAKLFRLKD
ncbi:MAG: glutamyl-tRNA reductase [Planctomycetota bacterium]